MGTSSRPENSRRIMKTSVILLVSFDMSFSLKFSICPSLNLCVGGKGDVWLSYIYGYRGTLCLCIPYSHYQYIKPVLRRCMVIVYLWISGNPMFMHTLLSLSVHQTCSE